MVVFDFVRSGGVWFDNGSVGGPHVGGLGNNGNWWSSRAYSDETRAHDLNFNASAVNPSNNNYRYSGFTLRCLGARVPIFCFLV